MKAVVQIRGEVNMDSDVADTLSMLNLHRVNHCTFIPDRDTYHGMIAKVNDYVAHGEPSQSVVATLLRRRAESAGSTGEIDDEWVAENTTYDDVEGLAAALVDEKTTLQEAGLEPTLRLHPPRGGHDGIKQPAAHGGQLGEHTTTQIDDLLGAMR